MIGNGITVDFPSKKAKDIANEETNNIFIKS
jgi:hypothetical protein